MYKRFPQPCTKRTCRSRRRAQARPLELFGLARRYAFPRLPDVYALKMTWPDEQILNRIYHFADESTYNFPKQGYEFSVVAPLLVR